MTFTIPTWLLWTVGLLIGIPAVVIIIMLAILGAGLIWSFKDGIY